jgi:hypothetical protein
MSSLSVKISPCFNKEGAVNKGADLKFMLQYCIETSALGGIQSK